jgi:hypothetical protein
MKCPHCTVEIHSASTEVQIGNFDRYREKKEIRQIAMFWRTSLQRCPACSEDIIFLYRSISNNNINPYFLAYPRSSSRLIPDAVPDPYRSDFNEACLVLNLSPKASAALSRRNLQTILREQGNTTKKDLYDQIEEISPKLPSHISEGLHAVRNIGNFAAHPMKSTNSGEILEVEPGEAEWTLDVLESLFDFYFVQPELLVKRKSDLNKKLREAGKPELP